MNQRVKKSIAREFLLLSGCLALCALVYGGIWLSYLYLEYSKSHIESEIKEFEDSLRRLTVVSHLFNYVQPQMRVEYKLKSPESTDFIHVLVPYEKEKEFLSKAGELEIALCDSLDAPGRFYSKKEGVVIAKVDSIEFELLLKDKDYRTDLFTFIVNNPVLSMWQREFSSEELSSSIYKLDSLLVASVNDVNRIDNINKVRTALNHLQKEQKKIDRRRIKDERIPQIGFYILTAFLILLYPVRLFILLLVWSIRTIQS